MRWKSTEIGAHLSCKFRVKASTQYIHPTSNEWVCISWVPFSRPFCIKVTNKLIWWARFLQGNKYLDNWGSETSGRAPPSPSPTAFCSFMPIPMTSPWEHLWGCAETITPGFSVLMHVLKSAWLLLGVDVGMVSSEFPPVSVWLRDAFLKLDSPWM